MIVDLERNDLNRVCTPKREGNRAFYSGSIRYGFHLVSDVKEKLEDGKNVMDLLEAAFPAVLLPVRRNIVPRRSLTSWNTASEIFLYRLYRLSDTGRKLRFQHRDSYSFS